jgi:hypothetical protein
MVRAWLYPFPKNGWSDGKHRAVIRMQHAKDGRCFDGVFGEVLGGVSKVDKLVVEGLQLSDDPLRRFGN